MSCLAPSVIIWSQNPQCRSWLQGSGSVNTANTNGKTSACLTFSPIPTTGSRTLRLIKMFVWRFVSVFRSVYTRWLNGLRKWFEWWCCETRSVWQRRFILGASLAEFLGMFLGRMHQFSTRFDVTMFVRCPHLGFPPAVNASGRTW